jgi:NADH-quinone oxidoreductase subunit E
MLRGGEELLVELSNRLGIKPGETSADGQVTLEFAECLGKCEGAPCVLIDDECFGDQTVDSVVELINNGAVKQGGATHG